MRWVSKVPFAAYIDSGLVLNPERSMDDYKFA